MISLQKTGCIVKRKTFQFLVFGTLLLFVASCTTDSVVQNSKFTELAPKLRYQVYDSYLKAQGIAAGMLSYEEVLMLVHAWRVKQDAQK